jgi:tetratricopeptide (TPR) repeat protein
MLVITSSSPYVVNCVSAQETPALNGHAAELLKQGLDLAEHGQLAQAEVELEKARTLAPGDVDVLTALAKVKGRIGELPAAIVLFRQVIAENPLSADAHVNLAIALADTSDLLGALDEASKAVELSPESAAAHLNKARILDDLHRLDEARVEFANASRIQPSNPDCFYYWALIEKDSGDLAKESELLMNVVRLQPRNENALSLLANSLLDQSKQSESITIWRRLLKINPNSTVATYGLAQALRRTDPQESRRLLGHLHVLKQRDDDLERVKSLGNQAYAAMNAGQWADAVPPLREAIKKCGGCEVVADLHKDLGLALCHIGNLREGKAELQVALQLNPSDRDTLQALTAISHQ